MLVVDIAWPRRAPGGPPKAEPGADALPAAPEPPPLYCTTALLHYCAPWSEPRFIISHLKWRAILDDLLRLPGTCSDLRRKLSPVLAVFRQPMLMCPGCALLAPLIHSRIRAVSSSPHKSLCRAQPASGSVRVRRYPTPLLAPALARSVERHGLPVRVCCQCQLASLKLDNSTVRGTKTGTLRPAVRRLRLGGVAGGGSARRVVHAGHGIGVGHTHLPL
jgi:hypothetical protein